MDLHPFTLGFSSMVSSTACECCLNRVPRWILVVASLNSGTLQQISLQKEQNHSAMCSFGLVYGISIWAWPGWLDVTCDAIARGVEHLKFCQTTWKLD